MRDQFAVDVLGEDEVEQELEEGSQGLINRSGLKFVPHHVASEHLNEITAEGVDCVYSDVGESELQTSHEVLLQSWVQGGNLS